LPALVQDEERAMKITLEQQRPGSGISTTDVITIDALKLFAKVVFAKLFNPHVESTEELVCSRLLANP
jgi:hypothetical protein